MADLNTDVRYIKGIGEAKAKALGKLGIFTLGDLIGWFPRRYEDRRETRPISSLIPGETACVAAMIASEPKVSHIRKGMDLVKVRAVDDTGALDVTFFNQSWLKNQLRVGETYIFYGRAEGSLLRKTMAGPVVEPEGRREFTGRIVPVYPLTAGVSQLLLSRAIRRGLDECADILPDCLPDSVRQTHGLCRVNYAYENIHFPESPEALDIARRRLAFEELFFFAIGLKLLRFRRETVSVEPFRPVDMAPFYDARPFILTGAQRRCVDEAIADMTAGKPMNRLCQGDVGSGKTMVAAACVYFCVKNGRQAALMAPTELLAEQLPYLTYLAPFTYGINASGGLLPLNDDTLLSAARLRGTAPVMHLSTLTESGQFDTQRAELVLTDMEVQDRLVSEVIQATLRRGYAGVDVDFEFLPGQLAAAYAAFLDRLRRRLQPQGRFLWAALAPKTSAGQPGLLYEGHDYAAVAAATDAV